MDACTILWVGGRLVAQTRHHISGWRKGLWYMFQQDPSQCGYWQGDCLSSRCSWVASSQRQQSSWYCKGKVEAMWLLQKRCCWILIATASFSPQCGRRKHFDFLHGELFLQLPYQLHEGRNGKSCNDKWQEPLSAHQLFPWLWTIIWTVYSWSLCKGYASATYPSALPRLWFGRALLECISRFVEVFVNAYVTNRHPQNSKSAKYFVIGWIHNTRHNFEALPNKRRIKDVLVLGLSFLPSLLFAFPTRRWQSQSDPSGSVSSVLWSEKNKQRYFAAFSFSLRKITLPTPSGAIDSRWRLISAWRRSWQRKGCNLPKRYHGSPSLTVLILIVDNFRMRSWRMFRVKNSQHRRRKRFVRQSLVHVPCLCQRLGLDLSETGRARYWSMEAHQYYNSRFFRSSCGP